MSIIRQTFAKHTTGWVSMIPKVEDDWNACRSTLEGHLDYVGAVAFSPDRQLVASVSNDKTIRLWGTSMGLCRSTLEGYLNSVRAVAFSPDGQSLETNRGQIPLSFLLSNTSSSQGNGQPTFFVIGQWVTYKGLRFLWLPPKYQPACTAVYSNIICVGHLSGRLTLLQLCADNIEW